jgi:hypothetical protein
MALAAHPLELLIGFRPDMGILLEWSNGGILWLALIIACERAPSAMAAIDPEHADAWKLGRGAFLVMASTCLVQANPLSPIASIFVGLDLGAVALSYRPISFWSSARSIASGGAR